MFCFNLKTFEVSKVYSKHISTIDDTICLETLKASNCTFAFL